ncbi:MAG: hypothetical protein C0631_17775 [Sedimenticola sp.]|jgi:hypothetical protein|nr:MAG: hypothetical protein C0631_17775 [Sedimenticola sp.]
MDWMKIGWALLLVLMILALLPRAKAMMTDSPKAQPGDWNAVLLPILGVVAFVMLLITLVR